MSGNRNHSTPSIGDPDSKPNTDVAVDAPLSSSQRLRLNPNKDHKPENYEGVQLDFCPQVFASLEVYLPPLMLGKNRDEKVKFMTDILLKYLPHEERTRVERHREYKQKIIVNYQPLHKELYSLSPSMFFTPSFIKAVGANTEGSFRSIMTEPSPGLFTFEMFQPSFCDLLLSEVENFKKWVDQSSMRIMRPNTMNKYGVVLDDFGFETVLDNIVETFIHPIAKVFFPEVGGSSLDFHHGFIVEYGIDRDVDLGFHVDDSEVTLNVCLGKQFSGGELFFRGTRCDKHVNTRSQSEEIFDYCHVPGQAILHRGRHRHGARATTSGHRTNLVLWCRSTVFREMKRYQKNSTTWCGECLREKKERQQAYIACKKSEIFSDLHFPRRWNRQV